MKHERRIDRQTPQRKTARGNDNRQSEQPQRELERHLEEAIELATD